MKVKLTGTPEQVELIKAMGSNDKSVSTKAQEAFASFIQPVVQKVLAQAETASLIYTDLPYNEDDSPEIPLDLYYGTIVDNVQVWSQTIAGGLPSSHVSGTQTLKLTTYPLDSAVNVLKRYARRARLDVVSAAITRMSQEILVRQERNAWAVLLNCLGNASTNGNVHVISATTAGILQLDDFNRLITRSRRINVSFANGTPDPAYSNGITDMFFSPEEMEQIRGFAYQPMNTRGVPNSDESTVLGLPDAVREEIFRSAGTQSIFNVSLHSMNEFGTGQKYNTLFNSFNNSGVSFNAAAQQIVVGVDLTKDAFLRPIAQNADSGSTVVVAPDDQWVFRSEKLGWYTKLEEGRIAIDARAILGLVV